MLQSCGFISNLLDMARYSLFNVLLFSLNWLNIMLLDLYMNHNVKLIHMGRNNKCVHVSINVCTIAINVRTLTMNVCTVAINRAHIND